MNRPVDEFVHVGAGGDINDELVRQMELKHQKRKIMQKLFHNTNVKKSLRNLQACRDYLLQSAFYSGETAPPEQEKIYQDALASNMTKLERYVDMYNLAPSQIYHLDEIILHSMHPTSKRIERSEYIRVLLCANSTGTHKLIPGILGRFNNPEALTLTMNYCNNRSDWMSSSIFKEWFMTNFITEVQSFLQENNLPVKGVLLTSRPRGHIESDDGNFCTLFLPPNMNSNVEPLYQSLRSVYAKEIQNILSVKHSPDSIMIDAIRAWDNVKKDDIERVFINIINFKKYCQSIPQEKIEIAENKAVASKVSSSENTVKNEVDVDNNVDKLSIQQSNQQDVDQSLIILRDYFEQQAGKGSLEVLIVNKMQETIDEHKKRTSSADIENNDGKKQRIENGYPKIT